MPWWRRRSGDEKAPRDTDALLEALDYGSPDQGGRPWDLGAPVRRDALLSLIQMQHPDTARLARRALEDPDVDVRLTAVDVLIQADRSQAAAPIVERALEWPEPGARVHAIETAAKVDLSAAISRLAAALARRPDAPEQSLLRAFVARDSSGEAGPAAARAVLAEVRENGRNVDPTPIFAVIGKPALGPLMGALGSQATRATAAHVLGTMRDADAVPALITILNANDPIGRPEAARALGEIRDPRAVEALLVASGDPDFEVRQAAGSALDAIGTVATVLGVAAVMRQSLASEGAPDLARLQTAGGDGVRPNGADPEAAESDGGQ